MKTESFSPSPDNALGRQVAIEYAQCRKAILQDAGNIEKIMTDAAKKSGATVVNSSFYCFEPQGVSGVIIIAQSHFTVHAWPEYQYAAVDIFTCSDTMNISLAINEMAKGFGSKHHIISSDTPRKCPVLPGDAAHLPDAADQNICVHLVQSAPKNDMIALYKDAGWWEEPRDGNLDFLDTVVTNSVLFAGAFSGQRLIGMGRALSDGVSDAYIQDVVVHRSFRGKGVGKQLVQTLVTGLKQKGIDWIGLIGEPDTAAFYEPLGFSILENYIPMKLTS